MILNTKLLKKPEAVAVLFGIFGGMLVHLFGLANVVHNSDDIYRHPTGYGAGVTSGRWLLTMLGEFLKKQGLNYNLNWVNGMLLIVLVALAAGFIVSIFHIRNRQAAALLGVILTSFPTVCSTMLYKYTAGFYGLTFLLTVLAVWVLPRYKLGGLLLSACCTAFGLGIYQAYLPVTAALFVLQLGQQTLEEDASFRKLFGRGVYACLSMVLGLIFYYIATKISLAYYNVVLDTYQGINEMGKISLQELPWLILRTYKRFLTLPINDYCDLATNGMMKLAYLLLYILIAALIVVLAVLKKKKASDILMGLLLCAAFPVAVNLIEIMCPNSRIYTLMVFSCVVPIIAPLVLLELMPQNCKLYPWAAKITAAILLVLVFGNTYYNNVTYTSTYYVNRQTENYMASMVAQIRMTEGFNPEMRWAFVGTNSDPMVDNPWQEVPMYGGAEHTNRMISAYSWQKWITQYLGYSIPLASKETTEEVMNTEEFARMPCWPAEGSVKVINDVVVIKFQEE